MKSKSKSKSKLLRSNVNRSVDENDVISEDSQKIHCIMFLVLTHKRERLEANWLFVQISISTVVYDFEFILRLRFSF